MHYVDALQAVLDLIKDEFKHCQTLSDVPTWENLPETSKSKLAVREFVTQWERQTIGDVRRYNLPYQWHVVGFTPWRLAALCEKYIHVTGYMVTMDLIDIDPIGMPQWHRLVRREVDSSKLSLHELQQICIDRSKELHVDLDRVRVSFEFRTGEETEAELKTRRRAKSGCGSFGIHCC